MQEGHHRTCDVSLDPSRAPRPPADAPNLCDACGLPFVEPEFGLEEGSRWRVLLHCQSCGWSGLRLFDDPELERLERELDAERAQIASDLDAFTEANMREYASTFIQALQADALLPEDF
jgi:hypothetical protein